MNDFRGDLTEILAETKSLIIFIAAQTSAHSGVIQRRAMRVVAEFIASIKASQRPSVYAAIVDAIARQQASAEPDVCIQLVAVDTLRVMVEDWDFKDSDFLPFLHPLLSHLPHLLHTCSSFDSHVRKTLIHWNYVKSRKYIR